MTEWANNNDKKSIRIKHNEDVINILQKEVV